MSTDTGAPTTPDTPEPAPARDAQHDPQPGDVLRVHDSKMPWISVCFRRVTVRTTLSVGYQLVPPRVRATPSCRTFFVPLALWSDASHWRNSHADVTYEAHHDADTGK